MTLLGETQSGVDKHLETKVLDPGSIEDERLSRVGLYYYSRCPGLPASSLPVCPVYRCFFFVPPRHPGLPVVCRYTGVVHFFMLAEPFLLLHTPPHAAAHNTTQHAGCCGQHPTLAYTPCHVRQENYANLVTALPPQNSPAAAHAEVACTAFAVILMTTRKSTASANHALQQKKSTSSTNDHSNAAKRKNKSQFDQ